MKLGNLDGRATVFTADRHVDVETASSGKYPSDIQGLFDHWGAFSAWASELGPSARSWETFGIDPARLGPPVPRPRQVFAVGLNYADHARESGMPLPESPSIFTKFPSCIAPPFADVRLHSDNIDWEVELVVVIGRPSYAVSRTDAWQHVAGLTVGQDISDRKLQLVGDRPQFSLAKSFSGFGPIGPWLVTPDDLPDPNDLAISCTINGVKQQDARTSMMAHTVADLVHHLSSVCELWPGDLIFTGTPEGVGLAQSPPTYLSPGTEIVSDIEGIGVIIQRCVAC